MANTKPTTTITTPGSAANPIDISIGLNGVWISWIFSGAATQTVDLGNITSGGGGINLGSFTNDCCIGHYTGARFPGGGSTMRVTATSSGGAGYTTVTSVTSQGVAVVKYNDGSGNAVTIVVQDSSVMDASGSVGSSA